MGVKYITSMTTLTPTATADTTALANNTYVAAVQGGAATQRIKHQEIFLGGQAASTSSPTLMVLGRDSTVGVTGGTFTGGNTALVDATSTAPASVPLVNNAFSTPPQRSATLKLLNLSFNAYGGVVRWLAAPDEEITTYGASASLGEVSLSAFTGGTPGALGSSWIYEVT